MLTNSISIITISIIHIMLVILWASDTHKMWVCSFILIMLTANFRDSWKQFRPKSVFSHIVLQLYSMYVFHTDIYSVARIMSKCGILCWSASHKQYITGFTNTVFVAIKFKLITKFSQRPRVARFLYNIYTESLQYSENRNTVRLPSFDHF